MSATAPSFSPSTMNPSMLNFRASIRGGGGSIFQAYYLPETEYVHWARAHPIVGLVNLVAAMKGWKRMFLQIKEAVVDDIYVHMNDLIVQPHYIPKSYLLDTYLFRMPITGLHGLSGGRCTRSYGLRSSNNCNVAAPH
ncbi:hypothetical protein BT93_L2362 [Corymbia citriodora subsp. variegata]|uniref:Uncharacterized protein n=1 Tax=Corymbia citriodora subsp. variegata TaxID=360336 RepID=A0A8T0CK01_CORYI|nr:hypothetical protein BT93_L2362 [Corymbia citriodora subsp. variegata]